MQLLGTNFGYQSGTSFSEYKPAGQYQAGGTDGNGQNGNPLQNAAKDGSLHKLAGNNTADTITIGATIGNSVVWGDAQDKVTLAGQWQKIETGVKEDTSGFYGDVYKNNEGKMVMVAGGAQVEFTA